MPFPRHAIGMSRHEELIQETIRVFNADYGGKMTTQDALEAILNVREFLGVLERWAQDTPVMDSSAPAAPPPSGFSRGGDRRLIQTKNGEVV